MTHCPKKSTSRRKPERSRIFRRTLHSLLAPLTLCAGLLAGFGFGRADTRPVDAPASALSGITSRTADTPTSVSEKLSYLAELFEDGRYWNHTPGEEPHSVLSVTDRPCSHSASGCASCNIYTGAMLEYFPDFIGTQCFGYASLLSDLLFGADAPVSAHNDFSKLRVGDMIQLSETMHSMIVTDIDLEAETITVTQVNSDFETCRIEWNCALTRSALYESDDDIVFYTRYGD